MARRSPAWPSASSRVVGVVGDPVAHSLSPLLHNAAFDAMGLDWVSVGFRVAAGEVPDALRGMRALRLAGLSVTTPHKDAAAGAVDELSPVADRLGAVNCIVPRDEKLVGESTDGEGLLRAVKRICNFDPAEKRCAVIGAGGAARAVVLALAEAGAAEVVVVNRSADRGRMAATLAGKRGRLGTPDDIGDCELVVQATTVGMSPGPGERPERTERPNNVPVDPSVLGRGQLVVDLVYTPVVTAFMEAAKENGARVVGGIGMLVHQAALAVELWTSNNAPVDAMWKAVRSVVPGS